MQFNLYTAGTREARTLLATEATFAAALRVWEFSQGGPDASRKAWAIVPVGEAAELEALGPLDSIAPGYDLGSHGRGVYVTRCGGGFSTLGFGYAARKAAQVAEWLAKEAAPCPDANGAENGSPAAYAYYQAVMRAGAEHHSTSGRRCPAELVPALIGLEGKRVEVTQPDGEKRRFWVGKSTGWLPCHLEIARRNSSGGGAVYFPEGSTVRAV